MFITIDSEHPTGQVVINTDHIRKIYLYFNDDHRKFPYVIDMGPDSWERVTLAEYTRITALLTQTPAPVATVPSNFAALCSRWFDAKKRAQNTKMLADWEVETAAFKALEMCVSRPTPALPADVMNAWSDFDRAAQVYEEGDSAVNEERFELMRAMFLTRFGDFIESQEKQS